MTSDQDGDDAAIRWSLLGLTTVTGVVDAVSFLGLGHIFTANMTGNIVFLGFFFFKQKTAYEVGLGIPAEPLFRSVKKRPACSELRWAYCNHKATYFASYLTGGDCVPDDQN